MLSISKLSMGQENYYKNLAREDYYTKGGEPPGIWAGSAAEDLGLSGQVQGDDFSDLFKGQLKGKDLVQQISSGRTPGWDLTFNAPKSVSVIFSQADEKEQKMIREIQQAASEKALSYLEDQCGFTRRGKAGHLTEKAKCVFATFEHGTSRAEQPHLHTHAILLNVCVRDDGTTGTIKTEKYYQHRHTAGAVYRAEMAHQFEQKMGLGIERDGCSFKVSGVSDGLCDHFSERRKEIEEKLKELGLSGGKASAKLTLSTRVAKKEISRPELMKEWRQTGIEHGWSTPQLYEILGKSDAQPEVLRENQATLAAIEGVEELMETRSYFREMDALKLTCWNAQGRGVSADEAEKATKETLEQDHIVKLVEIDGEAYFTTKEHLELEKMMMENVQDLKAGHSLEISEEAKQRAFQEAEKGGTPLSEEQKRAANHILEGKGQISTILGDAGTGKTTLLKPVAETLEASGYEVRGIAIAAKAAKGIEEGAGIKSGTIASFLYTQNVVSEGWNEETAKENFENWVQEKRATLPEAEQDRFNPQWTEKQGENSKASFEKFRATYQLTEKSVVVLDEAGMVDTKQFAQIIEHVKESGAKLVAIGDPKQLQAITQGGGFAAIAKDVQGEKLTEVYRQQNEKEKAAVREIAHGSVKKALEHYAEEGRLTISENRNEAKESVIGDWLKQGVMRPEENLILAGTRADVEDLNQRAQKSRVESGILRGESLTKSQSSFFVGDRVVFKRNEKKLGIQNGSFGVVRGFDEERNTVSIELDGKGSGDERTRRFSLHDYQDFKLGYAVTTHSAQGATVKNAYVLTDERMTDRQLTYVQASRVKNKARLYSTKEEAGKYLNDLVRKIEQDRQKELALEKMRREQQQKVL